MSDTATTHSIERISPLGGPFVGRCILCGQTGLTTADALRPCSNPRSVTSDDALLSLLDPSRSDGNDGGDDE